VLFINRFDIEKHLPKKQAHCMIIVIQKCLKADAVKVLWVKQKVNTVRYQINHYDVEKVIKHFEDKVTTGDSRFIKSWKRNLRIAIKIKEELSLCLENPPLVAEAKGL